MPAVTVDGFAVTARCVAPKFSRAIVRVLAVLVLVPSPIVNDTSANRST